LLHKDQVEAYRRDGFLAPLDVFSADEVRRLRASLEEFEASLPPGPVRPADRRKLHVRLPWMRDLVGDARLLDMVEPLVGPDILVFTSTFFVKEPSSASVTGWHQDATYFGLEPPNLVAIWLALSDAPVEAGCMRFVPGSHRGPQLKHLSGIVANAITPGSESIVDEFDRDSAVHAPLRSGQASMHHVLTVHESAPNRTADRRIGLSISYIPTSVRRQGMRVSATLVRGVDRYGHFDPEPDPRLGTPAENEAAHARIYAQTRAGYDELIAQLAAAAE
jgi:hypothetical protein